MRNMQHLPIRQQLKSFVLAAKAALLRAIAVPWHTRYVTCAHLFHTTNVYGLRLSCCDDKVCGYPFPEEIKFLRMDEFLGGDGGPVPGWTNQVEEITLLLLLAQVSC